MTSRAPIELLRWTSEGNSLVLRVDGYQFPGNVDQYDGAWLMVTGEVECAIGRWAFTDPCVMSGELLSLANLLERGFTPGREAGECFLEPVLNFDWVSPGLVRVDFRLEGKPPEAVLAGIRDEWEYSLSFEVTEALAAETAAGARKAAKAFPPQWWPWPRAARARKT